VRPGPAGRGEGTRRAFLAAGLHALAATSVLGALRARAAPPAAESVLACLPAHETRAAAWRRGVELGAEEAQHAARLLGRTLAIRVPPVAPAPATAARSAATVLSALGAEEDRALAAHTREAGVPLLVLRSGEPGEAVELGESVFFVASSGERRLRALARRLAREEGRKRWALVAAGERGDALAASLAAALAAHGAEVVARQALADAGEPAAPLRGARPEVLLLAVPDARLPALLDAARTEAPGARPAALRAPPAAAPGLVFAADWHPDLSRYGAAQLNERFARRFDARMDERAWAGWLAVKLASEVALRGAPADGPVARIAAVRSDGHVGAALRFRADDRHLETAVHVVGPPPDDARAPARILATTPAGEEP
jgi:hypothetical protein